MVITAVQQTKRVMPSEMESYAMDPSLSWEVNVVKIMLIKYVNRRHAQTFLMVKTHNIYVRLLINSNFISDMNSTTEVPTTTTYYTEGT